MLRHLTEYLARGVVVSRRLPAQFGSVRVYVTPDAQLRLLLPGSRGFDPQLLAFAANHVTNESVVWDIGSNCGIFAIAAAALARSGYVLAIEPDIWLAGLIRKSIQRSRASLGTIDILPAAMADRPGVEQFAIAQRGRAANSLVRAGDRAVAGGVRERTLVPALTLDLLLDRGPSPTLVKIDVERAEQLVLAGAHRVLAEARPVFHVEVGGESADDVSRLFAGHDYVLFDAQADPSSMAPVPSCPWETLAVPRELVAGVIERLRERTPS